MKEMGKKLADMSNEVKVESIMSELRSITYDTVKQEKLKLSVDRFVNQEMIADPYKERDSIHLIKLDSMYRNTFKVKSVRVYFFEIVRGMFEEGNVSVREFLERKLEQEEPKHRSSLYMARLFNNGNYNRDNYISLFKSTEVNLIMDEL